MVTLVDVGVSPVLRVPQFIDARGLPNLTAFRRAFESWFGIPLNVTEGARSRARQDMLWADWRRYVTYGGAWAPRAAIPYTSIHDEVTRALAVDLGSGLAVAGTPQAIWARANGPKYGVHPTGYSFGEPWHYDIRPGTETITLAGNTGTQITPNTPEDHDMYIITDTNPGGGKYLVGPGNLTHIVGPADDVILTALVNGGKRAFTFNEVKVIEKYMQKLAAPTVATNVTTTEYVAGPSASQIAAAVQNEADKRARTRLG